MKGRFDAGVVFGEAAEEGGGREEARVGARVSDKKKVESHLLVCRSGSASTAAQEAKQAAVKAQFASAFAKGGVPAMKVQTAASTRCRRENGVNVRLHKTKADGGAAVGAARPYKGVFLVQHPRSRPLSKRVRDRQLKKPPNFYVFSDAFYRRRADQGPVPAFDGRTRSTPAMARDLQLVYGVIRTYVCLRAPSTGTERVMIPGPNNLP